MNREMKKYRVPDEAQKIFEDPSLLAEEMAKGRNMQSIVGWSDEIILDMYDAAVRISSRQEYEKAADAFLFLTALNPGIASFWIGSGLCLQKQGRYDEALYVFRCGLVHTCDDWAMYAHTVRCCLEMKQYEDAINTLDLAIHLAKVDPEDPQLGARAENLKSYVVDKQKEHEKGRAS